MKDFSLFPGFWKVKRWPDYVVNSVSPELLLPCQEASVAARSGGIDTEMSFMKQMPGIRQVCNQGNQRAVDF